MVTNAGPPADFVLIASQVAAAGCQVRSAACSGVSLGGWFVDETQRGSISPMRSRWPRAGIWIVVGASPKLTPTTHRTALLVSRHRNVGGAKSGGKIDPSEIGRASCRERG